MSEADPVGRLASWIRDARHAVALTGAGVSTESGIPDFRSPGGGLWNDVDPMEVASIDGFHEDPAKFYRFWRSKFAALTAAEPNVAHRVLAALEARGRLQTVVTQNVDGLHGRAGSRRVVEVHGTFQTASCLHCGDRKPIHEVFELIDRDGLPSCATGEGLYKPDVVFFGEMLPASFQEGEAEVRRADLLLVLGSSLEVYPVADLVPAAKASGARVVILNRDPGPFDARADLVVHDQLGVTMSRLAAELGL